MVVVIGVLLIELCLFGASEGVKVWKHGLLDAQRQLMVIWNAKKFLLVSDLILLAR